MSKSLDFPEMFYKNSTKVLEGAEGTKNNLYLILACEKNEQLGDPDFGVDLHKAKFKVNTSLARELAIDGIIESQKFMNNILFFRDGVKVVKTSPGRIDIEIEAIFSAASNKKQLLIIEGANVE